MACYSPSPPPATTSSSSCSWYSSPKRTLLIHNSNNKPISYYTRKKRKRVKTLVISSLTEERASSPYNPIVFQASRLLGPPARFEASKLKVVLKEEEKNYQQHGGTFIPRTYTLSHCDFTAKLTLAISNVINIDQLKGWYNRDDVVAEWKKVKEEMCLHVHCYVSGGPNVLLDLAAEFRYHIFTKELPLVLKAVLHGDSMFFKEHPELMEAMVLVYFHSSSNKYNRVECWGALKNAAQARRSQAKFIKFRRSGKDSSSSLKDLGKSKIHLPSTSCNITSISCWTLTRTPTHSNRLNANVIIFEYNDTISTDRAGYKVVNQNVKELHSLTTD